MPGNTETKRNEERKRLSTALYIRLSREDGDKAESLSITNQRLLLTEYVNCHDDLLLYDTYIDDGYTGTSFERPAFKRMLEDIENRKVECVIVKDLSRLGRDLPKVSEYINEYFPSRRVRFIAVNDNVDKHYYDIDTSEDMMIDVKNMFNGFYPRDISGKVRSAFRSKQRSGQFIGAFASYGYVKSRDDHNRLEVDAYAAGVVRRIYDMYVSGMGQISIAKALNDEGILCPSEYKKQCGLNYRNSTRLETTSYWTYSTIRNILKNEIYIGNMVQNKNFRQICKKGARSLPRDQWIIVEGTHEPIIDEATWHRVQELLGRNTRQTKLEQNVHMFAGFLQCGDCGRAMVKIKRRGVVFFNCGSYNRYGKKICSIHSITEQELESIVLDDLNLIIRSVKDIGGLIKEEQKRQEQDSAGSLGEVSRLQMQVENLKNRKDHTYEDYADGVISREDYLRYRDKYEQQIGAAKQRIEELNRFMETEPPVTDSWLTKLLQYEPLEHLDRETAVEMISMIYVYENHTVKIVYNFSDELEMLLEGGGKE